MTSLISEICQIFCCPPRPSHIVAKFAFLPPPPTYTIVESANSSERKIVFKREAGQINELAKSRMEVFYTMTKRNSRIACLYIRYDRGSGKNFRKWESTQSETMSTASSPLFTVLFSHGNAVDIGQMAEFLQTLSNRFHVNILVYDYSGYGVSTGQTLEDNLYADAEAALTELRSRYLCPLSKIVLYGQSIGTAPTVEIATRYKVGGVILHSALMSGLRVVCPGSTRRFCFDPFTNIDKVANITSPTLVMHGTDDEVIGIDHGKQLHARLVHPLEPLWVEGAGHNDIELFPEYFHRLAKFFLDDMMMSVSPSLASMHFGKGDRSKKKSANSNDKINHNFPMHTIESANSSPVVKSSCTSSTSSLYSTTVLVNSNSIINENNFTNNNILDGMCDLNLSKSTDDLPVNNMASTYLPPTVMDSAV